MGLADNPIGVYEKALPPGTGWPSMFSVAHECGYSFIELSIDESEERLERLRSGSARQRELRSAARDSAVELRTMCLSGHRKYAFGSADSQVRARAYEIMAQAIELAVTLGIRIIQLAGYDVFYEEGNESSRSRYFEGLSRAAELASQASIMLGIENVDSDTVGSIESAMHYVDEINSPWMHLYPDIGNLSAMGTDVSQELRRGSGHLLAVHLKDTRPREVRRVPFGEGTVPFERAFRTLADLSFNGPFVVEMWNEEASDAPAVIREAREWLQRSMNSAEIRT